MNLISILNHRKFIQIFMELAAGDCNFLFHGSRHYLLFADAAFLKEGEIIINKIKIFFPSSNHLSELIKNLKHFKYLIILQPFFNALFMIPVRTRQSGHRIAPFILHHTYRAPTK